ncbi:MAG: hypothetical protein WAO35_14730 [Terriglobia bacterium]
MRHVIFRGHPHNLHRAWDTGLIQHINRGPAAGVGQFDVEAALRRHMAG